MNLHIHGEVGNTENPILFGYGDELDEEYKTVEKLKNNDFLKNMKTTQYLNTSNYRDLLNFIESDSYQIFVMGHSCGNSDRTLLNTLFENEHCCSIKVFYFQEEKEIEGKKVTIDNYSDLIMNISRNFNDKKLMRERVVNKTFCEALPQSPKKQ